MTAKAVVRWKVMIERPTTSGSHSAMRRRTVVSTERWARIRSATATRWCGSTLPASEVRAPFGMRTALAGMCSNESGMDISSTFIRRSDAGLLPAA